MKINKKIITDYIFRTVSTLIASIVFIFIISFFLIILIRGFKVINSIINYPDNFLFDESLLSSIIGSILISIFSTVISLIFSMPLAVFINLNSIKHQDLISKFRLWLSTINEIPPIIYGVFGFIITSIFNLNNSLLAGIIAMTILLIPYSLMIYDDYLNKIDKNFIIFLKYPGINEKYLKTLLIFFNKSKKAIIVTFIISLLNVIGNAATILFTSGFSDFIPKNISDPAATLPLFIIFNINSPIISDKEKVDLAVFIITIIILLSFILIKTFTKKIYGKDSIRN